MSEDYEMDRSAEELSQAVVGHRIIGVGKADSSGWKGPGIVLVLDNGQQVVVRGSGDCCAYTDIYNWVFDIDKVDNVITKVETDDNYETWSIMAGADKVLGMDVSWSEGTGYYMYGFTIEIERWN